MSLKYGLLGLLNYGKMAGYDLDKAFRDSINNFWQGQTSQIYRELKAMEKMGWLRSEILYQTDKPNKKLYEITDTGKQEYHAWLESTDESLDEMFPIRSGFLMRLFFAGDMPVEKAAALLEAYRDKCRERLVEMSHTSQSTQKYSGQIEQPERSEYWIMTALFGKAYYEAGEKWAGEMLTRLEKTEARP
jgi:DNA-binding PadR family transcriptional regulator